MGDPSSKRVDVAPAGTVTSAPFLSASRGLEVAEGKLRIVEEEVLIEQKARLAAEAENVRLREALTELDVAGHEYSAALVIPSPAGTFGTFVQDGGLLRGRRYVAARHAAQALLAVIREKKL